MCTYTNLETYAFFSPETWRTIFQQFITSSNFFPKVVILQDLEHIQQLCSKAKRNRHHKMIEIIQLASFGIVKLYKLKSTSFLKRFFRNIDTITKDKLGWHLSRKSVHSPLVYKVRRLKKLVEWCCFPRLCKLSDKEQKYHPPEHTSCVWHSEIWVIMRKRDVCLEYKNRNFINFLLKLLEYDPGK